MLFDIAYAQTDVYSLLLADNSPQLKQAAKIMASGQQMNDENAELLAEILWRKYKVAVPSDIDALSWACKALAETNNGRYRNLLQEIYQSQSHKKLRKYAKKSFNQLPPNSVEQFQGGENKFSIDKKIELHSATPNVIPEAISNSANEDEYYFLIPKPSLLVQERKLFAIAKKDWVAVKVIAQQLYSQQKIETKLLDALSQFLIENYLSGLDKQQGEVLAWICRAIGHSNNGRYTSLMREVSEQASDKKIKKYALNAFHLLPPSDKPFQINQIDFNIILNDLKFQ